jgi:cyclophilin family peptidyl-prolyl cis-trans isomerase
LDGILGRMKRTIILITGIAVIILATVLINKSQDKNMETTNTVAVMETNKGSVAIELFDDKAPKTVDNFVKLSKEGFYDGVRFHRVIENFMIQGGDPQSKDLSLQSAWGTGGPGYKFEDELPNAGDYKIGSLAMANSGPNTNGSQFFIVSGENGASLPPLYSLFGEVTDGMDVVMDISATPVDGSDRPVDEVVILSVKIK